MTTLFVPPDAATVIPTVVVWLEAPVPVPVMVSVAVPGVAFDAAVTVSVELFAVALVGLSVAVTPVGAPVTASATAPVKFVRAMFTVLVPVAPCATDSVAGESDSAKDDAGGAVT